MGESLGKQPSSKSHSLRFLLKFWGTLLALIFAEAALVAYSTAVLVCSSGRPEGERGGLCRASWKQVVITLIVSQMLAAQPFSLLLGPHFIQTVSAFPGHLVLTFKLTHSQHVIVVGR